MIDKFSSYNKFSNHSMELLTCMTNMHKQIQEFAKEASQENVDSIAKLANDFDSLCDAYKANLLNVMRELSGQEIDVIVGIQDTNGIRI